MRSSVIITAASSRCTLSNWRLSPCRTRRPSRLVMCPPGGSGSPCGHRACQRRRGRPRKTPQRQRGRDPRAPAHGVRQRDGSRSPRHGLPPRKSFSAQEGPSLHGPAPCMSDLACPPNPQRAACPPEAASQASARPCEVRARVSGLQLLRPSCQSRDCEGDAHHVAISPSPSPEITASPRMSTQATFAAWAVPVGVRCPKTATLLSVRMSQRRTCGRRRAEAGQHMHVGLTDNPQETRVSCCCIHG